VDGITFSALATNSFTITVESGITLTISGTASPTIQGLHRILWVHPITLASHHG
jgi:hypothetical protein